MTEARLSGMRLYHVALHLLAGLVGDVDGRAERGRILKRREPDDRNLSAVFPIFDRIGIEPGEAASGFVEFLRLAPARQARSQARIEIADDLFVVTAPGVGVRQLAIVRQVGAGTALVVRLLHLAVLRS